MFDTDISTSNTHGTIKYLGRGVFYVVYVSLNIEYVITLNMAINTSEVERIELDVKRSLCYWISNKSRKASDFQTTIASQIQIYVSLCACLFLPCVFYTFWCLSNSYAHTNNCKKKITCEKKERKKEKTGKKNTTN
jgi:hypothetical protein